MTHIQSRKDIYPPFYLQKILFCHLTMHYYTHITLIMHKMLLNMIQNCNVNYTFNVMEVFWMF